MGSSIWGALASLGQGYQAGQQRRRQHRLEDDAISERKMNSEAQRSFQQSQLDRLAEQLDLQKQTAAAAAADRLAKEQAAAQVRQRRVGALIAKGVAQDEAEAIADDEVAFREQVRPEKPDAPRNIDPLSREGIGARLEFENKRPVRGRAPTPLKTAPMGVVKSVAANDRQLAVLDDALAQVDANPNATGLKGFVPNVVLSRVDPKGNPARQAVADVGSLIIHDRSGAAVTISEAPRLKPFVPLINDNAETVRQKLTRLKALLQEETDALSSYYTEDGGYRSIPRRDPPVPPAGFRPPPNR